MIINPQRMQLQMMAQAQMQQRALTLSSSATPIGCCNFFDRCGDGDLMSLHFAGSLPILDYFGFTVGTECYKSVEFITYVRPEMSEGSPTAGHLSQPCADPNGWEFGSAKLTIEDFGRYGRVGPTRDIMKPQKYCATDPRWRLDGTSVTSENEWDMRFTMEVILQDISRDVIVGNASTTGKFNGLENLVKTGYPSSMLDSQVIDWAGNPMSGGAGITWNSNAVPATASFVDVLRAAVRRIKQRISWSPMLANQMMNIGDMILVMPTVAAENFLDFFTCWSVCNSTDDVTVQMQSFEARRFRDQLLGGLYGYGQITIDGIIIPIMAYDYGLIKGPKTADIYLLTGGMGSVRLWEAEHLSATTAAQQYGNLGYFATDGGRVLGTYITENECSKLKLWMHPRLWTRAPWAQVRFQSVQFTTPGPVWSGDPTETSFYPLSSFGGDTAVCP
ncbi:MAG: hypothetical protein KC546_19395 [Anaerolineae bacterium]|nr:hypothetical protein [Anaerolineae bacterium]